MQEKSLFQGKDIFNFLVLHDFVYQSNSYSKMTSFRRNYEDYFLWSFPSNYNKQDSIQASKRTQKHHERLQQLCVRNRMKIKSLFTENVYIKCPIYEQIIFESDLFNQLGDMVHKTGLNDFSNSLIQQPLFNSHVQEGFQLYFHFHIYSSFLKLENLSFHSM